MMISTNLIRPTSLQRCTFIGSSYILNSPLRSHRIIRSYSSSKIPPPPPPPSSSILSSSKIPPPPPPSSSSSSSISSNNIKSTTTTNNIPPPPPPPPPPTSTTTIDLVDQQQHIYDTLDLTIPSNGQEIRDELLSKIVIAESVINTVQEDISLKMIRDTLYKQQDIDQVNRDANEMFQLAKSHYVSGLHAEAYSIFKKIDHRHGMTNVFLGNMYLTGTLVKQDTKMAFNYFYNASLARVPVAFGMMGEMYLKGMGVHSDDIKARLYFDLAASLGVRSSTEQLVYMIINNIGGLYNLKKVCFYLKRLAMMGDTQAITTLGSLLYEKQKRLATNLWRFASRYGNVDALHYLGRHYYSCENPDYNNSMTLWTHAANKGHPESQFYLGSMYEMGLVVERNMTQAFKLYLLSAQQSNVNAQFIVGKCYYEGYGVQQDTAQAIYYLQLAAQQQDQRSIQLLDQLNN